jgi:tetratricopeptide (TPR) repeat protein
MSGPAEEKTVATGINGTNNSVQVTGGVYTISQLKYSQYNLHSTSLQENSIWFDVREPVESFTGRSRELQNLHKLVQRNLGEKKDKFTVISQVTSISGLGGIGKSEMAKMYARQHCQDYDGNVIWINAETYGTLTQSFHRLAKDKLNIFTKSIDGQEKDIKSIVEEVYKYFSNRKSLFIFDNGEKLRTEKEGDEAIDRFLPNFLSVHDNKPYIIITSRNRNWGDKTKLLLLDTFTEDEAIEFIKKELQIRDDSQEKQILQLAITLQYFPLALQQAVAYIKQTDKEYKNIEQKFEIAHYLKKYEQKARELLNFDFPKDNNNCYNKTTFITWEVTLEKIKQNEYGRQALEVLETIAFFAPDKIPIKLFLELEKCDTDKLASILQLPAQYSMINLEQGVINIHRLVQHVLRLRLREQQNEKETLRKALEFIIKPIEEGTADSLKCLPHAISVWNYASKHDDGILTKILIEVSSKIIYKLNNEIGYQDAYAFVIQTLELQERVLGPGHPSTLTTRHWMAFVLDKQGKYDEALVIYEEVLNIQERVLGAEHPSSLMTRHNMAYALDNQGKYDEALRIYGEVLNKEERVLGAEHPSTLTTRHNMALALMKQGKYDEALVIYGEVLNRQERVLGVEHPSTLTTRHNMASALSKQGKYDEALVIYGEVLNIRIRVLGAEHPSTLTTRNCMAFVLDSQGKYDKALVIYGEVLNMQERVLGAEHPSTLMTRHNMAYALDSQGKYDEALRIYGEVLHVQERVLGAEHPDTLTTGHSMALALDSQGKYDEALVIYGEVLHVQERVLGAEHHDTLTTGHNMALALDSQGKYDEALRIYAEVLNKEERVLGAEHPTTLITRHNMALALSKQGKYDEALVICGEVLNIQERVLGVEHPSTLTTRHNMALALNKQGKAGRIMASYNTPYNKRLIICSVV